MSSLRQSKSFRMFIGFLSPRGRIAQPHHVTNLKNFLSFRSEKVQELLRTSAPRLQLFCAAYFGGALDTSVNQFGGIYNGFDSERLWCFCYWCAVPVVSERARFCSNRIRCSVGDRRNGFHGRTSSGRSCRTQSR